MLIEGDENREAFSDCETLVSVLRRKHPLSGKVQIRADLARNKGWLDGLQKMSRAFQQSSHITALTLWGFKFTRPLESLFKELFPRLRHLKDLRLDFCSFDLPPTFFSEGMLRLKNLQKFRIKGTSYKTRKVYTEILRAICKLQVPTIWLPSECLRKIQWSYIFRNSSLVELHVSDRSYKGNERKLSLRVLKALMSSKNIKKFDCDIAFDGGDIAKVFGQAGDPIEWNFGRIKINLSSSRPREILALRKGFSTARVSIKFLNGDHPLFKDFLAVVERNTESTCFDDNKIFQNKPGDKTLLDLARLSNPRVSRYGDP